MRQYLLIVAVNPSSGGDRLEVCHGEVQDGAALGVREPICVAGLDLDSHTRLRVGTDSDLRVDIEVQVEGLRTVSRRWMLGMHNPDFGRPLL